MLKTTLTEEQNVMDSNANNIENNGKQLETHLGSSIMQLEISLRSQESAGFYSAGSKLQLLYNSFILFCSFNVSGADVS